MTAAPCRAQMVWSEKASEFCSEPQLMVAMPGTASSDFLSIVMKEVVEDMQELGRMADAGDLVLDDGTLIGWSLKVDKNDGPMMAMKAGRASTGSAFHKCARCPIHAWRYRDTALCLDSEPDTIESSDTLARKVMAVDGFSRGIDLRKARKPQLEELLRACGEPAHPKALRPEVFEAASRVTHGLVSLPRVLGGLPFGTVPQMNRAVVLYDYVLHGVKGIGAEIRAALKKGLGKLKVSFDQIEVGVMGNKSYYTGGITVCG